MYGTMMKIKFAEFEVLSINTIHDLDVYYNEMKRYIKDGFSVHVEVSCFNGGQQQEPKNLLEGNNDIFYQSGRLKVAEGSSTSLL